MKSGRVFNNPYLKHLLNENPKHMCDPKTSVLDDLPPGPTPLPTNTGRISAWKTLNKL